MTPPEPARLPTAYSRTQIRLHWLVFLLVAAQFIFHDAIVDAWAAIRIGATVEAMHPAVRAHVFGGIVVLGLVIWRLVLRARLGVPAPPAGMTAGQRLLANLVHGGLYAALVLMVVSGGMAWFGGIEAAADVHGVVRIVLLALVGVHVGASLWHQFWLRDSLLQRMR
jgi:cytochrome b561